MRDKIKELTVATPKGYVTIIKNRPEMLAWVMANTLLPSDRTLPEHIYSALNNATDLCENGKKMSWRGAAEGWGSCGRASVCQCAKESVSVSVRASKASRSQADIDAENQRREATNLTKYGVKNTGQTALARKNHAAFYDDPTKVASAVASLESTMMTKYGVTNAQQVEEFKTKSVNTMLERYGVENPTQSPEIQARIVRTNLEKYGVQRPSQTKEVQERAAQTNLEKYGVKHAMCLEANIERARSTMIERYGGVGMGSDSLRSRIMDTMIERHGGMGAASEGIMSKMKQTAAELYGTEWASQSHYTDDAKSLLSDSDLLRQEMAYMTVAEVAAKYGVSATTVYLTARDLEIPTFRHPLNGRSDFERSVEAYIREVYTGTIIVGNRDVIAPQELDIWLPDLNLAIECNGSWWHSELGGKPSDYHSNKTNKCRAKNIQLFHLWEHSWNTQTDLIMSMLLSRIKSGARIHARKCKVASVDNKAASQFFAENHIQGNSNANVYIGLYHNDMLIMCASFAKPRFNKHYEWELIRMATLKGHTVVGGASKLFRAFVNSHRPNNVLSYCDRSYGTGKVYTRMGFELSHTTSPNYWYTRDYTVFHHRSRFQKHKLKSLLAEFDPNHSEWQNMKAHGWNRIFDSGNDVYVWHKK